MKEKSIRGNKKTGQKPYQKKKQNKQKDKDLVEKIDSQNIHQIQRESLSNVKVIDRNLKVKERKERFKKEAAEFEKTQNDLNLTLEMFKNTKV
ncbi:hypothetical protein K502DRAFT_351046 [Neoconidiobolus thromboides FSU 785]|nr:hypothetical protein K502DRAFT_351046 [Neoconidiobolus thromboides FSU 785]